jgi:hypothetical protein
MSVTDAIPEVDHHALLRYTKPSQVNFSVGLDWVEANHSVLTNDPIRRGFSSPEYPLHG